MWLLPALSALSSQVTRIYYRLQVEGPHVPARGPVLLVANHPNSLLDPALVAAAAGRPVRFLAKAPLFSDASVGWLVRGSGSIPIYRAVDDPAQTARNEEMFQAVFAALVGGSAVGLFPEGTSHSAPALAPLKTGAARIALGAAAAAGGAFPIVPVGLSFRAKERFRSEALALRGAPLEWADLVGRAAADDAVRELTARIDAALRDLTLNLERWEDAPLVEMADLVYAVEHGAPVDAVHRFERMRAITEALSRLRHEGDAESSDLARELRRHRRTLAALRLRPADLHARPSRADALLWVVRHAAFALFAVPLAALGIALFWTPYRLTGVAEARARPEHDVRSTYKALAGAVALLLWILLLAALATVAFGWRAGLLALALLPPLGLVTLSVVDRWRSAKEDARRFLTVTRRAALIDALRARQRALSERLQELWERVRV
jgi:1-acyl-sn-glycerol-3-phosphate acyltransferase